VAAPAKAPEITSQPENVTVEAGVKASFTVEASGEELTYQWYYSMDNGATWKVSTAAAAKTKTFSITAADKWNGMQLKCVITGKNGMKTTTEVATLNVAAPAKAPEITSQPENVTVEAGVKANFTVEASGEELTYQWYYSMDNGTTWKISTAAAAKTKTFSITAADKWNGMQLKCVITGKNGMKTTTEVATLTVAAPAKAPEITSQPVNVTVEAGVKASFTVEATGEELTYQWYYSMDNGATWKVSTAAAAKTKTFGITAADKWNGMQLKCVITGSNGMSATSNTAVLTVE